MPQNKYRHLSTNHRLARELEEEKKRKKKKKNKVVYNNNDVIKIGLLRPN